MFERVLVARQAFVRVSVVVLGVLVALGAGRVQAAEPGLEIAERHKTFGDRYQDSLVEQTFEVIHTGEAPITVTEIVVVDGTGEVTLFPLRLEPGAVATVLVRQPLARQLGHASFRYALITDEPDVDRYRFTLSGFVESAYDPESVTVEFGDVDRELGGTVEFEVSSREVPELNVGDVKELPDGLTVDVQRRSGAAGQGILLHARLAPHQPLGLMSGSFELQTNVAHQPKFRVFYRAHVVGDVVPSENPLQLGVTRIGDVLLKTFDLSSRSGQPIEIQNVTDSAGRFGWTDAPCAVVPTGPAKQAACRQVTLTLEPEASVSLQGKVSVFLSGQNDPVVLNYRGIVVSPDTVIKKLDLPNGREAGGGGR